MIEKSLTIGGIVAFWSLAEWSTREVIKEGLLDLGLAKYIPEPRTPAAALKDALGEVYTMPTQLIRPLNSKEGFTVVEEERGLDANEYRTLLTAKINKNLHISCEPYSSAQSGDLVNRFNRHMGLLTTANVSAALVKLLDMLGGTKLRPTGSIYWLPDFVVPQWVEIAGVFERAAVGRPNAIYRMANVMDGEAIRAVRDAVVAEVQNEAARIDREVQSGELGEKALENRKEQAQELAKKIHLYEELLGCGLQNLVTAVERAENAACVAALTLSVSGGLVEQVA